jgi:hypothetical protein
LGGAVYEETKKSRSHLQEDQPCSPASWQDAHYLPYQLGESSSFALAFLRAFFGLLQTHPVFEA